MASVCGLALYLRRLTGLVLAERGNVASAVVHLPSSARDNDNTGRYFAHKCRIADSCITLKKEPIKLVIVLDNGAMSSARAAAISVGFLGDAAAACPCR